MEGCTIMSDWPTDQKREHLINFLASCPRGTMLLDSVIVEVYGKNVVQIVTTNVKTCISSGKKLERRKYLHWTLRTAYSIDHMLEKIENINWRDFAMMRTYAKGRELQRLSSHIICNTLYFDQQLNWANKYDGYSNVVKIESYRNQPTSWIGLGWVRSKIRVSSSSINFDMSWIV